MIEEGLRGRVARGNGVAMNVGAPAWPKSCRCGETWTRTEWSELPAVGRYLAGTDGWLELRSCVCGVTLTAPAADLVELASSAAC